MEKFKVGIIGCTGMVGQRFITLTCGHPWFELTVLAASARSAGRPYGEAVEGRWKLDIPMPEQVRNMTVLDAEADMEQIAGQVDFVFSAVDMKKEEIRALEEAYAKAECPVVSNNSAHRWTEDVPMVVPEINPEHLEVIAAQRKRLGTQRGFIAVKSNCSIQSYAPALHPLRKYGIEKALVCTYQAISGAGKTFETWPEMVDNVIPYIGGEEEEERAGAAEGLGQGGKRRDRQAPPTPPLPPSVCGCPCPTATLPPSLSRFENKPSMEQMKQIWADFKGIPQELDLPTAPKQFFHYFEESDRPQCRLDRMLEGGMAISIGRLRPDTQYDYKFVCLSHNTLRGAAGGAVLLAELLCAQGYIGHR